MTRQSNKVWMGQVQYNSYVLNKDMCWFRCWWCLTFNEMWLGYGFSWYSSCIFQYKVPVNVNYKLDVLCIRAVVYMWIYKLVLCKTCFSWYSSFRTILKAKWHGLLRYWISSCLCKVDVQVFILLNCTDCCTYVS